MTENLKPCPFCGSKVTLMSLSTPIQMFYCNDYNGCGAVVSFDNDICNREAGNKHKIRAWNRRAEKAK